MGLHAYCITPAGVHPPAGLAGLGGAPVEALAAPGCLAWCSTHPERPAAGLAQLQLHDRVVRAALSDRVTPVPLRFGQWFPDAAALERQLAEQGAHWAALLARLAGTVEMGLRLAPGRPATGAAAADRHDGSDAASAAPTAPAARTVGARDLAPAGTPAAFSTPGAGRAFLERLRAEQRGRLEAEAERSELLAALAALAGGSVLAEHVEAVPGEAACWRVAHLVRTPALAAYRRAVGELRRRHPDARIIMTGPWPPYCFAHGK